MYQFIIVVIDYLVSWCALTETKDSFTLVKGNYSFYLFRMQNRNEYSQEWILLHLLSTNCQGVLFK